jgi:hypothetical protein
MGSLSSYSEFINSFNSFLEHGENYLTFTENGAVAYSTTGSKCLDFFTVPTRGMEYDRMVELFSDAYKENPQLALQILFNLRDCRNGKQEKRISLYVLKFIRNNLPKTYLLNIDEYLKLAYFKDLLFMHEMTKKSPEFLIKNIELELMGRILLDDNKKFHNENEKNMISLMAKWAPTEGTHFDKRNNVVSKLVKICGLTKKEYRKMISELREHLKIVEKLEAENRWNEINFERVPSKCMKNNRKAFNKHLPEEFKEYLDRVKKGESKMNTMGIQPHELISNYLSNGMEDEAIDTQFYAFVERLKKNGLFENTISVCDVSGSMIGSPMKISISLGLILSELTNEPFKNKVITFSENPQLFSIEGETLKQKVDSLKNMD